MTEGRFSDVIGDAKPQLVLLLEGANDLNALRREKASTPGSAETVSALEDMVRDAGFRGIPVMLATLPPQRAGAPKAAAATFLDRFNGAVKTMAAKKGAQVVDVNALLSAQRDRSGRPPPDGSGLPAPGGNLAGRDKGEIREGGYAVGVGGPGVFAGSGFGRKSRTPRHTTTPAKATRLPSRHGAFHSILTSPGSTRTTHSSLS